MTQNINSLTTQFKRKLQIIPARKSLYQTLIWQNTTQRLSL